MADQKRNDFLSDNSASGSQEVDSPAVVGQTVNKPDSGAAQLSGFGRGTGSSLRPNENLIRRRVSIQQHLGTNAIRVAESHQQQASPYFPQGVNPPAAARQSVKANDMGTAQLSRFVGGTGSGLPPNGNFTGQRVMNQQDMGTAQLSRFVGGTGSGLPANDNFTGQRVMNRQHPGRTTQSQSRSQDLAYSAHSGLMEFTNAIKVAEQHLQQAGSNLPFAISDSISQHNDQIGIAHGAWANFSNTTTGQQHLSRNLEASNMFAHGNLSDRHDNNGSSLMHGRGTVMQGVHNRGHGIQTNIQSPSPAHGQMHWRPSSVGVNNMIPMNTQTTLAHGQNFPGGVPGVTMNTIPVNAISSDMPYQIPFGQNISGFLPGDASTILSEDFFGFITEDDYTNLAETISGFIPGDVDAILDEMQIPRLHGPNLAIGGPIDPHATPIGMQRPFVHGQHFPQVIPSDLHTSPANTQMHFVHGQNISRAPPVAISQNPTRMQIPLRGQSSSAVMPRDRQIPTNMQKPLVSGQNLSRAVPRDTNKTPIDQQRRNHQGESSTTAMPRDSNRSPIFVQTPPVHGKNLTDNNAPARTSVAKSSVATQGQSSSHPLPNRIPNNSERSTTVGSSIAGQSSTTAKNKSSLPPLPTPRQQPIHHIKGEENIFGDPLFELIEEKCQLCNMDMAFPSTFSTSSSSHNNNILPSSAVLPCNHCYHFDCLKAVFGSPGQGEVPLCFLCSEGGWSSNN